MAKFAQGRYNMKILTSTLAVKHPLYRSSWEFAYPMKFRDESPKHKKWASESIRILQTSLLVNLQFMFQIFL